MAGGGWRVLCMPSETVRRMLLLCLCMCRCGNLTADLSLHACQICSEKAMREIRAAYQDKSVKVRGWRGAGAC